MAAQLEHAKDAADKADRVRVDLRVPWDQNANADRVRSEFLNGLWKDWCALNGGCKC